MKTKIKICGITDQREIQIINTLPIHFIGFIFAPSKRRITIEKAIELKKKLREDIKTVGVFVNASPTFVNKIAKELDLDIVQLHGEEDIEYINKINSNIWKAYKIDNRFDDKKIVKSEKIIGNLFDGKNPGSGEAFNWSLIKKIKRNNKLILAGGLNPMNIRKAIKIVNPDIIDVSSGVEENNKKNKVLLENLVRRIQND